MRERERLKRHKRYSKGPFSILLSTNLGMIMVELHDQERTSKNKLGENLWDKYGQESLVLWLAST